MGLLNMGKNDFRNNVQDWLVDLAAQAGLNIKGYKHKVTQDFKKHVLKQHGNSIVENARGQIPVTEKELEHIDEILQNPDFAAVGIKRKNKYGKFEDRIILVKTTNNSTILFEEVLSGKKNKALNAKSLIVKKGKITESSLIHILESNNKNEIRNIKIKYADAVEAISTVHSVINTNGRGQPDPRFSSDNIFQENELVNKTSSTLVIDSNQMEKEYQEYFGTISPDEESSRRINLGKFSGKLENQQAKEELNVSTYKFQSGETLEEIIKGNSVFPTEAALLDNLIDGNIREVYEYATDEEKTVLRQFASFRNDYDTDIKNLAVQTDCVSRWIATKHWNPEMQEFQEDYVNHAAVAEFPYKLPWEMKEIESLALQTENKIPLEVVAQSDFNYFNSDKISFTEYIVRTDASVAQDLIEKNHDSFYNTDTKLEESAIPCIIVRKSTNPEIQDQFLLSKYANNNLNKDEIAEQAGNFASKEIKIEDTELITQIENVIEWNDRQNKTQVDIPELKLYHTLKEDDVRNLEVISDQEFAGIVDSIILNDYKNIPNAIRLPNLNEQLSEKLGLEKDSAFILKKNATHIRPDRKGGYGQALNAEEYLKIPEILRNADFAVVDTVFQNFQIVFDDKKDGTKINKLVFNKDELGNYLVTLGKVDRESAFSEERNPVVAVGVAPTIQTLRTSASSTALRASTTTVNETIPQVTQKSINEQKTMEKDKNLLYRDIAAREKQYIPELKIHSELKEEKIKNLKTVTQEEFDRIVEALYQDGKPDYKSIPEIIRLPKLNDELAGKLNIDNENFFLKTNIAHSRPQRKGGYDQNLRKEEMKGMLDFISSCQTAYIDTDEQHQNFFLAGLDEKDNTKANKIVFNKDELGNYIVTIGKVDTVNLQEKNYAKVAVGVEPTIWSVHEERSPATMLRPSTTLATEETIPQVTQKSINEQKTKIQILEQDDNEQLVAMAMASRKVIKEVLDQNAEPLVEIDFSKANYDKLFPRAIVQTPLETVKLGENQFEKLDVKDRKRFLLATFQTLATPDLVIDEERNGNHSHNYIKSFVFDEKTKVVQDVVVNISGENISITAHPRDINNIVNKIKMPDQLVYAAARVGQVIEQRTQEAQSIVNPTRVDRLSTISVPLNKEYSIENALSIISEFQSIKGQKVEPEFIKKFEKLKNLSKTRTESEENTIPEKENSEGKDNTRHAIKSKSDIIRQAGKDFLKSVVDGTAPFFNAEDDFQRIIMRPQAIINSSNGLPFSGESQLLAQIYHTQKEMKGEIVTSIAGAKEAGTIILNTPENRSDKNNFVLTDTTPLAQKNAVIRTRYFMPESCEEPEKIYAHTLQQQRPEKIRSYRDLIRHFENIPNGQKEIADIRIRIAHEHLKEIQSRFAVNEERTLSVDEIEERKNFLRNYFERLPSDYRDTERGAFEDTFGIQLNPEKSLEINLEREFKDIDFDELKKNTKKSIELENRKLSDFIEKNTMANKKVATLFCNEYKTLAKEEKLTARNLKIEALGIKEPETFLGKYLAACNTNAEFITDKETMDEVKKNLVKKMEENFKIEKYDILKEIGQQAQTISNETTKQISFEKAHSNKKNLGKNISPEKEISLIGMGK